MDNAQHELTEKITSATNILVTVSSNPSVDQLAACIGLTLILNKLNKHATAVFSGEVPSTLEFLQPEGTLEKNTDSLRDFIIAIDKSKADKLRYKVEDQLVRIFITPYRTSITQNDLEFSQGDFNVELVVALGVQEQTDLDTAITAHGRILHDAAVSTVTTTNQSALGSINWNDSTSSSLCELIVELAHTLGQNLLDEQIATALLTGIVSETARFSNEKTTPKTMSASSELLAAGADQQLVATKLQPQAPQAQLTVPTVDNNDAEDEEKSEPEEPEATVSADGTLEIDHEHDAPKEEEPEPSEPEQPEPEATEPPVVAEPPIDEAPAAPTAEPIAPAVEEPAQQMPPLTPLQQPEPPAPDVLSAGPKLVVDPPILGGTLTANSQPEPLEPALDPLGLSTAPASELLDRSSSTTMQSTPSVAPQQPLAAVPAESAQPKAPEPILTGFTPPPPAWVPPSNDVPPVVTPQDTVPEVTPDSSSLLPSSTPDGPSASSAPSSGPDTLLHIEEAVNSPHLQTPDINQARDEVSRALVDTPDTPEPIQALNAQPLGGELHPTESTPMPQGSLVNRAQQVEEVSMPQGAVVSEPPAGFANTLQQAIPATPTEPVIPVIPPSPEVISPQTPGVDTTSAPPVPPPIPYHFGNTIDPAQS